MTAKQLRDEFFEFFRKRDHAVIPGASLIPQGDSSTLFISAGMHPLVPYLLGELHPSGKRLVDLQECLRTGDIDNVGDEFHHTWFEMLGNWSLGDYWKKEAISWSFEFLTEVLAIKKNKLSVTCFAGDKNAPRDSRSAKIWQTLGVAKEKISFHSKEDNWWGPVGKIGPCGPNSEMFIDTGRERCEIWNDVFMEFNKTEEGKYLSLQQKNVDTGMGVERVLAVINGVSDDYLTSIWQPIIRVIEVVSGKKYREKNKKPMRIIADHLRAAVFVIAAGVFPGNKEQGYVLRRLIRRSIRQGKFLGVKDIFTEEVAKVILGNRNNYAGDYPELEKQKEVILKTLVEEERRFRKTLNEGLKKLAELFSKPGKERVLSGEEVFRLYETFGFPFEMVKEEAAERGFTIDEKEFFRRQEEHREKSRQSAQGRFRGGLGERSPQVVAYHTATHLLHQALREVLGLHVSQQGSAITPEKMRFDFAHPSPLTPQEIKRVEEEVNKQIKRDLPVKMETMSFAKSQKEGALAFFKDRYPSRVKVYSLGNFSKEVCGGPHVASTGKLGRFKIIKEESCGAGKRRIYAVLERKSSGE